MLGYPELLIVHTAATLFMVGVIWFVQVVHYPLLLRVDGPGAAAYAAEHQRRTSWVVGAPMMIEALTAPALLWIAPVEDRGLVALATLLLAGVWASTVLQLLPRHRRLLEGFDRDTVLGLVRTNALRACLWTAKGATCLWLVTRADL